jgi:predicted nucleic acid-binding protein
MFVLDTNVLSALMLPAPPPEITSWIAGQSRRGLFTTAVSQGEILAGIAVLPEGRRRQGLAATARLMFEEEFHGRVLPFDAAAAVTYAEIFAARRLAGRPSTPLDLIIAAVARTRKASVVTRDSGGFAECGVAVINPWQAT